MTPPEPQMSDAIMDLAIKIRNTSPLIPAIYSALKDERLRTLESEVLIYLLMYGRHSDFCGSPSYVACECGYGQALTRFNEYKEKLK